MQRRDPSGKKDAAEPRSCTAQSFATGYPAVPADSPAAAGIGAFAVYQWALHFVGGGFSQHGTHGLSGTVLAGLRNFCYGIAVHQPPCRPAKYMGGFALPIVHGLLGATAGAGSVSQNH